MKGSETMSFQENLRYHRKKAGYQQAKDFAMALNISYSTYKGYESEIFINKQKILQWR